MPRRFAQSPPVSSGLVGLGVLLVLFALWPRGIAGTAVADLHLFIALVFGAMAVMDLCVHRAWRQAGLRGDMLIRRTAPLIDRVLLDKLLAVAIAAGLVWLVYRHAAIYQDPWYRRFTDPVLDHYALLVLGLAVYVVAIDRMMVNRVDDLALAGAWLRARGGNGNTQAARNLFLSTLIKAFFLPLMYGYALDDWLFFYGTRITLSSFTDIYEFLYRLAFFIDVIFAVIGYAVATRLLNSQVRWPEQTLGGWVVCLVCYMPFWQIIGRSYFDHASDVVWGNVLVPGTAAYVIWGSAILALLGVYMFSTVLFGTRFSNLTYRGTIWRGPYALTRHPAYLSKNLTMWMIHLPFLASGLNEAAGNVLALLGVNALYLARARFEERCCRQARDYRIYERMVRRHGLIARLRRLARRILTASVKRRLSA